MALIPGETVGPELMRQAEKALEVLQTYSDLELILERPIANSASVDTGGLPLPEDSEQIVMNCDAVLYGTLSHSKYSYLPRNRRPEYSMNIIRNKYSIFSNIRRIYLPERLKDRAKLKREAPFDILVIRDLSCGLSSSQTFRKTWIGPNGKEAVDAEYINEQAAERCARLAFETAEKRRGHVMSLDKSSLNDSSVLWHEKMDEVAKEYPTVKLSHEFIDTAAMKVIEAPDEFDVVVTMGAYGDIFMDEVTALSGVASILGSAELAEDKRGIYTPNMVHCPNEWMEGKGVIYPGCIFDAIALLLEHSLCRSDLAEAVRNASICTINSGKYTADIWKPGDELVSTDEVGDIFANELKKILVNKYGNTESA